jgi:hypothetical protein
MFTILRYNRCAPDIPLDIVEATWRVQLPGRVLTTDELIGYRARALAKHQAHVDEMRRRIAKIKRASVADHERRFKDRIKDYVFKRGDLVLMRNTAIQGSQICFQASPSPKAVAPSLHTTLLSASSIPRATRGGLER